MVVFAVPAEFADGVIGERHGAEGQGSHVEVIGPDALSGISHRFDQVQHIFPGPILRGQFLVQLIEHSLIQVDHGGQEFAGHEVAALAVHITHAAQGRVELGLGFLIGFQIGSDVQAHGIGHEGIQVQPEEHVGQVVVRRQVGQGSGAVARGGLDDFHGDVGMQFVELVGQSLGQFKVIPGKEGDRDVVGGVQFRHGVFRGGKAAQGQRHGQNQQQGYQFFHVCFLLLIYQ